MHCLIDIDNVVNVDFENVFVLRIPLVRTATISTDSEGVELRSVSYVTNSLDI